MPLPFSRKRPHGPDDAQSTGEPSSNVKVIVRIRPPNVKEIECNFREVVQAVDENVLVFDPKENSSHDYVGRRRPRDLRQRRNKDLKFAFDHVFDPSTTNLDVYNETTNTVLTGLLNGYNCSVFAYGASGAGKTFTMLGSKDHPGVMYHTMMDLYARIDNMKDTKTCNIAVSYLEIYNETIRDLLMPGSTLPIREDPGKGVVVPGLSLHKPKSAEELLYMLQFGNQSRTQHPTDANAESSRSHAVLQVFVRQTDRTANISTEVRVAKLCLVDLAGSERATVTKNRGSRFREGANINRSLLALGNVINALAENKTKGYVPYRDSKLTRLLKDSLGGNCQTVMIAAVSPSSMSYEDTYNTLRYADRAKHIKATLKKNVINVDFHMAKYVKIVEELRKEIVELKVKLKVYEESHTVPPEILVQVDTSSFIGYKNEMSRYFIGQQSQRCEQLQQEISLRNVQWKMYRKQRCLSRLTTVDERANIESQKKIETMLNGMNQKSSCLTISSESSRSKLVEGYKSLADLEQNIRSTCATEDNELPEVLSLSLQLHGVKSNLQDANLHVSYIKHVVRCQEKELQHNERLIHLMLKLLKRQHYIIKGHNMLTSDLAEEYSEIQRRVAGQEVCWGDQEPGTIYTRGYTLADMLNLPSLGVKPQTNQSKTHQTERLTEIREADKTCGVFEFTAAQVPVGKPVADSYPYKVVDECSPPKAKRVLMAASHPHPAAARVHRLGNAQTTRTSYRSGFTPIMSRSSPSMSRSVGEATSVYSTISNSVKHGTKTSVQNSTTVSRNVLDESKRSCTISNASSKRKRNTHRRSASVGSSIDFDTDESQDQEEFKNSRFSKVNDTMTKSKKFSHLHVQPESSAAKSGSHRSLAEERSTLNGTFSIVSKCECAKMCVKKSVIISDLVKSCPKCAEPTEINSLNVGSNVCNASHPRTLIVSTSQTNSDCHCGVSEVVPAQKYTTCVETIPIASQYGAENDSGASTIVDQSSNSVTSLASVSTLVEGQNLSQEISHSEDSNGVRPTKEHSSAPMHNIDEHLQGNENAGNTKTTKCHQLSSGTLTISSSSLSSLPDRTETDMKPPVPDVAVVTGARGVKAMRCIKFDNIENSHSPPDIKSYADIVRTTPTPERQPLQQVGNCNTPLSSPRCDSRSSFISSDSDSSFDKLLSGDKLPPSVHTEEFKENCRILNELGLPSLVGESMIGSNKCQMKKNQSFTPGYMQTTKAHMNRKKHNTNKNSSLNSSGEDSLKTELLTRKMKTSVISKHGRPLSSHRRSKSTSTLSSRAGWQI